jgi:hypothetical protein
MKFERKIKSTLTPIELNKDDSLVLTLSDGTKWEMKLLDTSAEVIERAENLFIDPGHEGGDIAAYAFEAAVLINGREVTMRREVASKNTFYKPWEVDGVRIWFDAASCAFKTRGGFMAEKDWHSGLICCPGGHTRWAVQESGMEICPEPLHDWYPNPSGKLDISECYLSNDCWMGPYNGGAAHCGLDINMPSGTVLTAPIDFDEHFLYDSLASGDNNNRWMGIRRWPDDSIWVLNSSHLIDMLVETLVPMKRGTPYATTAGTHVGAREHTHFIWRIFEQGGAYYLDPWILMHEIWNQRKRQLPHSASKL